MNPFLCLPPETAHAAVLRLLRSGLVPAAPDDPAHLEREVLGIRFSNPVGLSAGADKEATALAGWDRLGFGFIEIGTVMPRPRPGNTKPRIWRFPENKSIVNWLGLPSGGPEPALENIRAYRSKARRRLKLGVSIASAEGELEDFRKLARVFSPLADYLTLNASCPNVAGHAAKDVVETMKAQVRTVTEAAGACPVLLKLGPTRDADVLRSMAEAALEAGAKGFVACNTVPYDRRTLLGDTNFDWPQRNGQPVGGYSGPQLLDISCRMVSEIRRIAGPQAGIIGVGGIQGGEDARTMFKAGADLIQLYTGFIYRGPALIREIKAAI